VTRQDEGIPLGGDAGEVSRQCGLADAGLTPDDNQPTMAAGGIGELLMEQDALGRPPDYQRRRRCHLRRHSGTNHGSITAVVRRRQSIHIFRATP
jgi:hypothetical protein